LSPALATPEIYTRSLHDALPILARRRAFERRHRVRLLELRHVEGDEIALAAVEHVRERQRRFGLAHAGRSDEQKDALRTDRRGQDRKSTRLNSSHDQISYAVFCL